MASPHVSGVPDRAALGHGEDERDQSDGDEQRGDERNHLSGDLRCGHDQRTAAALGPPGHARRRGSGGAASCGLARPIAASTSRRRSADRTRARDAVRGPIRDLDGPIGAAMGRARAVPCLASRPRRDLVFAHAPATVPIPCHPPGSTRPEAVRDRSSRASAEALPRPAGRAGSRWRRRRRRRRRRRPRRPPSDAGTAVEPAAAAARPGRGRPGRGRGRAAQAGAALRRRPRCDRKKIPFWAMPVLGLPAAVGDHLRRHAVEAAQHGVPTQLDAGRHRSTPTKLRRAATGRRLGRRRRRPPARPRAAACSRPSPTSPTSSQFVWLGSDGAGAIGTAYGDPNRAGGQHIARQLQRQPRCRRSEGASPRPSCSTIVRHERETLRRREGPGRADRARRRAAVAQRQPDARRARASSSTPTATPLFDPDTGNLLEPTPAGQPRRAG